MIVSFHGLIPSEGVVFIVQSLMEVGASGQSGQDRVPAVEEQPSPGPDTATDRTQLMAVNHASGTTPKSRECPYHLAVSGNTLLSIYFGVFHMLFITYAFLSAI